MLLSFVVPLLAALPITSTEEMPLGDLTEKGLFFPDMSSYTIIAGMLAIVLGLMQGKQDDRWVGILGVNIGVIMTAIGLVGLYVTVRVMGQPWDYVYWSAPMGMIVLFVFMTFLVMRARPKGRAKRQGYKRGEEKMHAAAFGEAETGKSEKKLLIGDGSAVAYEEEQEKKRRRKAKQRTSLAYLARVEAQGGVLDELYDDEDFDQDAFIERQAIMDPEPTEAPDLVAHLPGLTDLALFERIPPDLLQHLLDRHPRAFGADTESWLSDEARCVISERFGVRVTRRQLPFLVLPEAKASDEDLLQRVPPKALKTLLTRSPEALGIEAPSWDTEAVAELITRWFRVRIDRSQLSTVLREARFTQGLTEQADQRS